MERKFPGKRLKKWGNPQAVVLFFRNYVYLQFLFSASSLAVITVRWTSHAKINELLYTLLYNGCRYMLASAICKIDKKALIPLKNVCPLLKENRETL